MTNINQNSDGSKSGIKRKKTDKVKVFDDAQYLKMSNHSIDILMPKLSPNAWKLLCFFLRKTRGFQRDSDALSYPRIKRGTGISSSDTVNAKIRELLGTTDDGRQVGIPLIKRRAGSSRYEATNYEINCNAEVSEATFEPENGVANSRKTNPITGLVDQSKDRTTTQSKDRTVLKEEDLKKDEEEDSTSSSPSNFQNSPRTEEKAADSAVDSVGMEARQREAELMLSYCSKLLGVADKPELQPMARNVTENLLRAGRTPDQLHRFGIWWMYCNKDGGLKNRLPWPKQIDKHWDEAMKTIPDEKTVKEALKWAAENGRQVKFSEMSVRSERLLKDW